LFSLQLDRAVTDDILAQKQVLRRSMAAKRDAITLTQRAHAASSLAALLMARIAFPADACIGGYFPFRSEFDLQPLLRVLHETGRALALPTIVARGQPLLFRRHRPGDAMAINAMGIPEPSPEAPEVSLTHMLVPLLAFDDLGYRLGYGGGYYDRTLAALQGAGRKVASIGIGFDLQRLEEVPRDAADQRLDLIVTERDLYGPHAGAEL
jgi:5-formyltetrahydrofolate cyclo-ligase